MTSFASPRKGTYIRFYDVTGIDDIGIGTEIDYFDFMPSKAKLYLQRGLAANDHLPRFDNSHGVDGEYDSDGGDIYVSGQDNYRKTFDSKVVSRCHAAVRWMPTQQKPTLIDQGSTHGTYLSHLGDGVTLSSVPSLLKSPIAWKLLNVNDPTALADGDMIQLGRPVRRGDEDFTPLRLFVSEIGQKNQEVNAESASLAQVEVVARDMAHEPSPQPIHEVVFVDSSDSEVYDNDDDYGNEDGEQDHMYFSDDTTASAEICMEKVPLKPETVVTTLTTCNLVSDGESESESSYADHRGEEQMEEDDVEREELAKQDDLTEMSRVDIRSGKVGGKSTSGQDEIQNDSDGNADEDEDEAEEDDDDHSSEDSIRGHDDEEGEEREMAAPPIEDQAVTENEADVPQTARDGNPPTRGDVLVVVEEVVTVPAVQAMISQTSQTDLAASAAPVKEMQEATQDASLAGKKRSIDEAIEGTHSEVMPALIQSSNGQPSYKRIKRAAFGAGMATGFVAGMVGTIVGLSSFALNDSVLR